MIQNEQKSISRIQKLNTNSTIKAEISGVNPASMAWGVIDAVWLIPVANMLIKWFNKAYLSISNRHEYP